MGQRRIPISLSIHCIVPRGWCGWACENNPCHFSFSELLMLQCLPILVFTQVLSKGLLLTMTIINDSVSRLPSTSCHFRACLLYCRLQETVFVFMFCLMQCQAIHSVQQTLKVGEISLTVILLQILSLLTPYREEQMSAFHMHCYISIFNSAK